MIIYRDQSREANTQELLDSFDRKLAAHESLTELLIDFGEIEAAIVDALCPEVDRESDISRDLRSVSCLLGRAFMVGGQLPITPLVERIRKTRLPENVTVSVPEGYAYYGLYPEMYLESARRFIRERRPGAATVIGIRSIGTSLSAVVAAALNHPDTWSLTVRPREHPFDRRLALDRDLEARIESRRDMPFLIVDEGPGLSGSSFACVARRLVELGARDIVLFPSWNADPAGFVSETARREWPCYPKFVTAFEEVMPQDGKEDLSAGQWRGRLFEDERKWPAVQPQHERRKYLDPAGRLWKFAGLGRYGRERTELASRLSEIGFVPKFRGLQNGFAISDFVEGRPSDLSDALLERFAAYLKVRRGLAPAQSTQFNTIHHFLQINCAELTGRPAPDLERWRDLIEDAGACRVDGRMLRFEWLAHNGEYLKADAVDHHADHFLPGCVDIGWDVASTCVEWDLNVDARSLLIERMNEPGISRRLPFWELAYLAFRAAYASIAAGALGDSPDASRFGDLAAGYTERLSRQMLKLEKMVP